MTTSRLFDPSLLHLVTGGAGYLGSFIARRLLAEGCRVRIFDLKPTKYVPEGAELHQADMRDAEACRAVVRGVDTVFHTAFVQSFSRLAEKTQRAIDLGGTENFLEASLEAGCRRFVHASTIEIYGTRPPLPCPEDAPIDPVGVYGKLKWECEQLIMDFHGRTGFPVTMLRMPTICGPGFYNHKPLLTMMDRILDGRAVAVVGDGSTVGDFVHVDDVVQGFLLAAERPGAVGQAFNISCEITATHLEMIQSACQAVGSRSRILHVPPWLAPVLLAIGYRTGASSFPPEQFGYLLHGNRYSVEKAKSLLGYRPAHSAASAMASLIRGYQTDREFVRSRTC